MVHLFVDKSHHARVLAIDSLVILAHIPYSIANENIESAVFKFNNEDTRLNLTFS